MTLEKAGASVEERDRIGLTPIAYAASNNPHPEIIEALVKSGADIAEKDRYGITPFM